MCMTGTAVRPAAARLSCPWGTRSRVFRPAREHHVVDDQRVLTRREQLREPHLAAIGRGLEDVVLRDEPARRQRPALGGDLFVQPPELASAFSSSFVRAGIRSTHRGSGCSGRGVFPATWSCRVACPWAPWCFILSIPASFPILRFFTTPRGEREDHVVGVGGAALIIVDDLPNHSADTQPVAHRVARLVAWAVEVHIGLLTRLSAASTRVLGRSVSLASDLLRMRR